VKVRRGEGLASRISPKPCVAVSREPWRSVGRENMQASRCAAKGLLVPGADEEGYSESKSPDALT